MNEAEMKIELGKRIRSERLRHKLSQATLAQRIRISRPQLVNIECGRHRLSLWRLVQIAAALGVELGIFLAREFAHVPYDRAKPVGPKPRGAAALKARVQELERQLDETKDKKERTV